MLVVAQLVVTQPTMSVEKLRMLGRFLRLTPPEFSRAPGYDALNFVTTYEYKLHNLGLVETYGVDYTTF